MIVCNKCGDVIEEKLEEEIKEAAELKAAPGKKNFISKKEYTDRDQKDAGKLRRPSIVVLPYQRGVNGFLTKEYDLCDTCRELLANDLNELKFVFTRSMEST